MTEGADRGGAGRLRGLAQAARRGSGGCVCVSQGRADADRGEAGEPPRWIPLPDRWKAAHVVLTADW